MRAALILLALAACSRESTSRQLDVSQIVVLDNARLRTDTVGDGKYASESTFVLVDAKNPTPDGAYVTLGGDLLADGGVTGHLKPASLWIPSGEVRTFALIDTARVPRPATTAAKIVVTGALITADPPRASITDLHAFTDAYTEQGKPLSRIVVQANVVNAADRIGKALVIGAFHGADGRPMTRPFQVIDMHPKGSNVVQFVGPPGSVKGTIYVGDVQY